MRDINSVTTLSNGIKMPWFGFGTYKVEKGSLVVDSVREALKNGYRHIDTASYYDNEEGVGQAIRESGIPREDIFLVSKVWNSDQGYESTLKAFDMSLKKLEVEYLDLYLIHWPHPLHRETWMALEKLYSEGKVKAIGVSNFKVEHLKDIMENCKVKPMVNQIEFHPQLIQDDLMVFCRENNIQLEAWSPLMRGKVFEIELLKELAIKYKKSIPQIVLRWDLQMGVVTIPKSINPERIKENSNIFDFEISGNDMERICLLNSEFRIGSDPDRVYQDPEIFNKR
ncbi:MAG: aldo/keto reductase [Clostridium sp.]